MMVTSCATTISPGRVSSQFPPRSAAKSTMTEPGAIVATISAVTSTGGRRPGTTAAVMTTQSRHRREHVHALRNRCPRHQLQAESRRAGRGNLLYSLERPERAQETDQNLTSAEERKVCLARPVVRPITKDLDYHVGLEG